METDKLYRRTSDPPVLEATKQNQILKETGGSYLTKTRKRGIFSKKG